MNDTLSLLVFLQHVIEQLQPSLIGFFQLPAEENSDLCMETTSKVLATFASTTQFQSSTQFLVSTADLESHSENCAQVRALNLNRMLLIHISCGSELYNAQELSHLENRLANDYLLHDHIMIFPSGSASPRLLRDLHRDVPGALLVGYEEPNGTDDLQVTMVRTAGWDLSIWWQPTVPGSLPPIRRTELCRVTRCRMPSSHLFAPIDALKHEQVDMKLIEILGSHWSARSPRVPAIPCLHLEATGGSQWSDYPQFQVGLHMRTSSQLSFPLSVLRETPWLRRTFVLYVPNWWHWRSRAVTSAGETDNSSAAAIAIAVSWLVWLVLVAVRWLLEASATQWSDLLLDMWARANAVAIPERQRDIGLRATGLAMLASLWGCWNAMTMTGAMFGLAIGDEWAPVFERLADVRGTRLCFAWTYMWADDLLFRLKTEMGMCLSSRSGRTARPADIVAAGFIVHDGYARRHSRQLGLQRFAENGSLKYHEIRHPMLWSSMNAQSEPDWLNHQLRTDLNWLHATGVVQHLLSLQTSRFRVRRSAESAGDCEMYSGIVKGVEMATVWWLHGGLLAMASVVWLMELGVRSVTECIPN